MKLGSHFIVGPYKKLRKFSKFALGVVVVVVVVNVIFFITGSSDPTAKVVAYEILDRVFQRQRRVTRRVGRRGRREGTG
uniref:Uncharacterized protein n=1 Tax=Octopus bimaculoides TaxID=37653 RepID=A0A0L8FJ55_OCTBM